MLELGFGQLFVHLWRCADESRVLFYLHRAGISKETMAQEGKLRTLYNRVRMYERTTNLTRSTSVCTSMMRKCSSSDESGSARRSCTSSD